jgi:hypothetical protein
MSLPSASRRGMSQRGMWVLSSVAGRGGGVGMVDVLLGAGWWPAGRRESKPGISAQPAASRSRGGELWIRYPRTRPRRSGRAAQLPEDHSAEARATPVDEVTKK